MKVTIFSKSTGRISRTASVPVGMAGIQLTSEDEDWIEGSYSDDKFYIQNFTAVPMPQQPSPHHVFNYTTKQWEDPRTLADLKAAKNHAINLARAAANSGHFVFQGHRIAADPLSRSDIDAAHGAILMTQALPPGWPGGWKSMENDFVPITTVAQWAQFYGTMVATGTANFNHAQALKTQLAAAQTPEAVDAVPNW